MTTTSHLYLSCKKKKTRSDDTLPRRLTHFTHHFRCQAIPSPTLSLSPKDPSKHWQWEYVQLSESQRTAASSYDRSVYYWATWLITVSFSDGSGLGARLELHVACTVRTVACIIVVWRLVAFGSDAGAEWLLHQVIRWLPVPSVSLSDPLTLMTKAGHARVSSYYVYYIKRATTPQVQSQFCPNESHFRLGTRSPIVRGDWGRVARWPWERSCWQGWRQKYEIKTQY